MSTQNANKAIFTNIKTPVFTLNFMDKTGQQHLPEEPESMAAHFFHFPGNAAKSKQQTGFQAAIKNYLQQKVNRR